MHRLNSGIHFAGQCFRKTRMFSTCFMSEKKLQLVASIFVPETKRSLMTIGEI